MQTVAIKEIQDTHKQYANGEGELTLFDGMTDKAMLKLLKNAIKKANGAAFKVKVHPDFNEPYPPKSE